MCALPDRPVTFQHRQASGHGGRGVKAPVLLPSDGLALCNGHNTRAESDLQTLALVTGVKVRRWVRVPSMVPVMYVSERSSWWLLDEDGGRLQVSDDEAAKLMRQTYGGQWDEWLDQLVASDVSVGWSA